MESVYIISSVLTVIALILALIIGLIVYLLVLSRVVSRYALPIYYKTDSLLGRGLQRFVYPEGRSVLYEPHPSIRKYIRRYSLFTLDGYKYLRLRLDGAVTTFGLSIIMYDNKDRAIDAIDVVGRSQGARYSAPIALNEKTSYVALVLTSVNGNVQSVPDYMEIKSFCLAIYFAAASLLTFIHISLTMTLLSLISSVMASSPIAISYSFFIIPSILIGAICLGIVVASRRGKGAKVVLK